MPLNGLGFSPSFVNTIVVDPRHIDVDPVQDSDFGFFGKRVLDPDNRKRNFKKLFASNLLWKNY